MDNGNPWQGVLRPFWWPFVSVLILGCAGLLAFAFWGISLNIEKLATEQAVALIESDKLTLADVNGTNLPPYPDAANTTLEGVDKNVNGIRDDVENAIFEMYPTAPNIRAAELQYAKALQWILTDYVFSEGTFVAAILQEGRASYCVTLTGPEVNLSMPQEEIEKRFAVTDGRKEEVENLVLNTKERKNKREEVFGKFMTSHGDWEDPACDIDPDTL